MTVKARKFEQFIREYNASLNGDDAKKSKWTVSYKAPEDTDVITLTAKHPVTGQQITLVWDNKNDSEVYNYPESVYSRSKGDNPGEWTIRNVSEARMIVLGKVTKGSASGRRGGRPRNAEVADKASQNGDAPAPATTRKRAKSRSADPVDQSDLGLPFNLDDDDETVLKALSGKLIYWRRGAVRMSAEVHPKNLSMKASKNAETPGRRFVQFADNEGFKTVYLDIITKVTDAK
jgi:hypothetical protein